ncbi:MAG: hypothetical protein J0L82_18465 [Deltaproteobacteria bacterium]|nr:hypothetical protein [Deltaproteobacteria bacterium]
MNTNKIMNLEKTEISNHRLMIPLEKAVRPSLWARLTKPKSKSDLSFEQWESLEGRRCCRPLDVDQRGRL